MKRITGRMLGLVLSVFWVFAFASTFNYSQTPEAIAFRAPIFSGQAC